MPIKLNGSTSGYSQLQAAAVASSNTLTLPAGSGSLVAQSTTTAPTNGQIPIGNGTDYTAATITAGTGMTITNAAGSVTLAADALSTASGSAPSYSARAWVNFNGTGTVAIRASGNVSSITDNGVGDYTVNFTTAMPDANYSITGMTNRTNYVFNVNGATAPTASAIRLGNYDASTAGLTDAIYLNAAIFR